MSRDAILGRVRARQGDPVPLPSTPTVGSSPRDGMLTQFCSMVERVGGTWVERSEGDDLTAIIRSRYPDAERIVSTVEEAPATTYPITTDTAPSDLVQVQLAVVRGRLGVAENAAVWIDEEQLPHRALPFVAEHLVLLLSPESLVPDLHAAYAALDGARFGFGVFVSGPSKTADIEQSLVMGAQGPRTLLVVVD